MGHVMLSYLIEWVREMISSNGTPFVLKHQKVNVAVHLHTTAYERGR